ncbi:protein TIF31 [Emericellopsis cladophorae]|uniref:Clustered mitochondria protein homolog n=1 Tax=Emericellopsis cladophorae TaxID=2686198 RepID=A0A9Q0BCU7_9HYPO|nr:protein TIF31 [Emericellopsis cladophorae]KAI6779509.1 protein TIF31 [Emericellopsis cladophorae]
MATKAEEPTSAPANKNTEAGEHEAVPEETDPVADALVTLTIVLPDPDAEKIQIPVSTQEQVHEIRQSIIDLPSALRYTCFHLEHNGQKINDFIPLSEIPDLGTEPEFRVVQDPYTEKEARIHLVRIRELIGAAGDRTDTTQGVLSGASLFETVTHDAQQQANAEQAQSPVKDYDFAAAPSLTSLVPMFTGTPPKTVKTISLSPWNPPPPHLRQRGHLLYLLVGTNEGEQYQITAHVSGFFVNKSSNAKLDPFPKPAPKAAAAHSLLDLLPQISASFAETFVQLQEHSNLRDPLATFQISNAIPASPWAVPAPTSSLCTHVPDATRPQEPYLLSGVDNQDTLRDWNEEFTSAKELPKESVQDRVFRERLINKLFADYNDAAVRGAVMIARDEIPPLNPTECRDAQIFVYNNIFFSFGADGVGTFTSEGGDDAARVATGKDIAGVQLVNQLDIDGLYTPATVLVDYLGKRIVAQSIVPGIFRQPEPGESQIDYGALDGKDAVAADERFTEVFATLSKSLRVKKHPVWDKEGKRFDLEGSVETKGLMGTDGRKYALDLYRITPLDINWLEEDDDEDDESTTYPHRMTVLRPELIDIYARFKMRQFVNEELARNGVSNDTKAKVENAPEGGEESAEAKAAKQKEEEESKAKTQEAVSKFKFALNPDAFSGQQPKTEEEKAEWAEDEKNVREVGQYLRDNIIPELLKELTESDISFPMDGQSLSRLLHKRGINVRYLGTIAWLCTDDRLACLRELCIQDMITRSFKHVAAKYLKTLPVFATTACVAHLLNCLLGHQMNNKPAAQVDESLKGLYPDADWSFEQVTPVSLREEIEAQALKRFRHELEGEWYNFTRPNQQLREVCLRLGIQLEARDYSYTASQSAEEPQAENKPEATKTNGQANGQSDGKKKKKSKAREASPAKPVPSAARTTTFIPDDIVDIVPVVKHSCPRSALAEEALEAGRLSLMQGQKKLGQELLLESLSLHEQIYGILHPEVARVYNTLSMLYYNLDDKEAAVELARKAIVVAERTVGVDSAETLLNYLNLSLFLHQTGDSKNALVYTKHALKLWKIIYGPDHPDSITTLNNAAVMLQHVKGYHESRLWFEESLRVCESVFGKQSVNSATLLFQLAQALALDHDSKAAVNRMRESYNVFHAELGPEDKNTKEAETWLEQLTQNAVSIAKHAKDAQAKRIRSGIRFPTSTSGVVEPAAVRTAPQVDSRSVDELIKFIEGGDQQSKPSKKRPAQGNPKRRGRAAN